MYCILDALSLLVVKPSGVFTDYDHSGGPIPGPTPVLPVSFKRQHSSSAGEVVFLPGVGETTAHLRFVY